MITKEQLIYLSDANGIYKLRAKADFNINDIFLAIEDKTKVGLSKHLVDNRLATWATIVSKDADRKVYINTQGELIIFR